MLSFGFRLSWITALLLFISGLIPQRAIGACYADGQPPWGCELAASGWPFPFIHDGYTSPMNSADWLGWMIGSDIWQWGEFYKALTLAFILAIFLLAVWKLTYAESADDSRLQYIFKPLAAAGFLAIPTVSSLAGTGINPWFFGGLIACAVGDMLLLSRNRPALFKLGMGAFAIGHLAYVGAFIQWMRRADDWHAWWLIPTGALVLFSCVKTFHWLRPHLPKDMVVPVIGYTAIIGLMVTLALTQFVSAPYFLPAMAMLAAILFAVSDIYVARDRFVVHEPKNARRITPLYFGAQLLFAVLASI